MDGLPLFWREMSVPQNLPNRSILLLDDFLEIPALLGMDEERNAEEIENMLNRSFAIRDFIDGRLSPDCLEMALDQFGLDPYQVAALWEKGVTLK